MRRRGTWLVLLLLVACGRGGTGVEAEVAATTFLVTMPADQLEVVGRDRLAVGAGDEDRLEVIRAPAGADLISIYPATPVPEPFEFVRNPLAAGAVETVLASADRVVAVLYPLIDSTPGGRVLAGSLVALGPDGRVVGTDWNDAGTAAIAALVDWGNDRNMDAAAALQLAVAGLGGDDSPAAAEAADFLR